LDANLLGYAYWDDSLAYAAAPSPDFIDLNLSREWLGSMSVDILCVADASGRILHETGYGRDSGLPLDSGGLFATGGPGRSLVEPGGGERVSGFLPFGGGVLALSSREIRASSGEGPAGGRMVFGRLYSQADSKRLSELLLVEVSLEPAGGSAARAAGAGTGDAAARAAAWEPSLADSGDRLVATRPIQALDGRPAGFVVLRHPKAIIAQGESLGLLVTGATILFGFILLWAIYGVTRRGALLPLERLSSRARLLAASGGFGERLPADRDDEVGDLARSFNGLLDRLANANEGLERKIRERTGELVAANEELELMGEVFSHSLEGILVTGPDSRILAVNPAFERITGFSAAEANGKDPSILASGRHGPDYFAEMRASLEAEGAWAGEIWNRRPDGTAYPIWISVSAMKDDKGRVTRYVGVFRDVSDVKKQEDLIRHQAFHDALTGLPNRLLLSDRIASAVERASRRGTRAALLFLDLDRFKIVNDSLGHAAGDALLQETAKRLKRVARGEDTIARLGGDEFVILLEEVDDGRIPADVALRVLKSVGRPVEVAGKSIRVGASIGIAMFPADGSDSETLLRNADTAMYRAKDEGRNTFRLFTPELNEKVARRLALESELRRDVEEHALFVLYQPQVDLASGLAAGFEALVRWRNREGRIVSPDDFIPLAEETGLVVDIDRVVMEKALAETAGLLKASGARLSVNCSTRGLLQKDFPERIGALAAAAGLDPSRLELEVTETSIMHDVEASAAVLRRIADMGVAVALDDFGTGYSSLARLRSLPLSTIKIDKSFVFGFLENEQDQGIIDTILSIAARLGLRVVAEGVETEAQAS
ncbi:MAG TPA: EAL domain-containing protein, partial [Spirochaetia bacterium]|nr:EAL domain-containing protein [Spirochaetia bacterium]